MIFHHVRFQFLLEMLLLWFLIHVWNPWCRRINWFIYVSLNQLVLATVYNWGLVHMRVDYDYFILWFIFANLTLCTTWSCFFYYLPDLILCLLPGVSSIFSWNRNINFLDVLCILMSPFFFLSQFVSLLVKLWFIALYLISIYQQLSLKLIIIKLEV